jgi:2-dehydropantoate 2-reductase
MRVLVFGAGAIGSVLGGLLAERGHAVTLLGRPWHLDAVRRHGLVIDGLWGTHRVSGCVLATEPPALDHTDWVLVCVKSHDTRAAAAALAGRLGPGTLVCAFQNGLGNYECLTAALPREQVALGRVIFGAEIVPGRVTVTVCADDVLIGAPDPAVPAQRLGALAQALREAGVPARTHPAILTALWAKVLYNCALNGLSMLLEVSYGGLPQHLLARRLMGGIIAEAYQVAGAHGMRLEPSSAAAYQELLFTRLIPDTAAHQASMLQDLRRGKPTEIEALNGALVRLGHAKGVPTPANALITRLVHQKERFVGL